MKPSVFFILTSQFLLNDYTEGCCNKKKINYRYEYFLQTYLNNDFSSTNNKWQKLKYNDTVLCQYKKIYSYIYKYASRI